MKIYKTHHVVIFQSFRILKIINSPLLQINVSSDISKTF